MSLFNPGEADILLKTLMNLLEGHEFENLPDIGIISPYREQVKHLQELVNANDFLRTLPNIDINTIDKIDMTADGADEIDSDNRMIKGGGGALLREKIIASSTNDMIIIVDESKLVKQLGGFPLPVEI